MNFSVATLSDETLADLGAHYTAKVPRIEDLVSQYPGIKPRTVCRLQDDEIQQLEGDIYSIASEWLTPESDCLFAEWDEMDEIFRFVLVPPAEVLSWLEGDDDDDDDGGEPVNA